MSRARLLPAGIAVLIAGCGGAHASKPEPAPTPRTKPDVVVLGDSISLAGPDCDGCTSFADLFARQLGARVDNRAIADATVADVLDGLQSDAGTRAAVRAARTVVVQVGFNDTPWNREDDPCGAAPQYPRIAWSRITPGCTHRVAGQYERSLDVLLKTIGDLTDAELRVLTLYNAVLGDHVDPTWDSPAAVAPSIAANRLFARIQCRLAGRDGGVCAQVGRAFNGAHGTRAAQRFLAVDHTHPNALGHRTIAGLLAATS